MMKSFGKISDPGLHNQATNATDFKIMCNSITTALVMQDVSADGYPTWSYCIGFFWGVLVFWDKGIGTASIFGSALQSKPLTIVPSKESQ